MPFRGKSWFVKTFIFFQNFGSNAVYKNVGLKTANLKGKAELSIVPCALIFGSMARGKKFARPKAAK